MAHLGDDCGLDGDNRSQGRGDRGHGGDDRGQLLLVAVLVLAAAFIVLALVVNSAIFTENMATRDDTAGTEDALEYRAEVVDTVERAMVDANTDPDVTKTEQALDSHIQSEIEAFDAIGSRQRAASGRLVDITLTDSTVGERIAQDNASRTFTDLNGNETWNPARGIDSVRNVQFNFTEIDTFDPDGLIGGEDDPFLLEFEGPDESFTFRATSEGAALFGVDLDDEVAFSIDRSGVSHDVACVRDEDELEDGLTVDRAAGTVAGEPCEGLQRLQDDGTSLWYGETVTGPANIEIQNGDNVRGTYSMVVDGTADGALRNQHDDDEPYRTTALYSVALDYHYQTHAVTYETELRAVPGGGR